MEHFHILKKQFLHVNWTFYLSGIDENTYEIDGSVRILSKATVSRQNYVELSDYRTENFKNGKISGIWEWADYGGLINQLDRKKVENYLIIVLK